MNNLKEPIRIIASGQEYSVEGILYPDDTVKINRGSLISRKCTTTIKLEKNYQLRDRIISTRVDSNYRLKYDEIFPNRTVAAIIVSGSERNGNDFFKTVDGIRLGDYSPAKSIRQNRRILFCNIAYLKYYDGRNNDIPRHGGAFVEKNQTGGEKWNFKSYSDGYYYGFVETKHPKGTDFSNIFPDNYKKMQLHNIDPDYKDADEIDNVLVVFCAKKYDKANGTVIVGWYDNASVYRTRRIIDDRQYNLKGKIEDAFLLNESERKFFVPRASNNEFGFGQSNTWYANEDVSQDFVEEVYKYVRSYSKKSYLIDDIEYDDNEEVNDIINDDNTDVVVESNKPSSKVVINGRYTYLRRPEIKAQALKNANYKCEVDNNHITFIRKNSNIPYTEGHHLIPISAQGEEKFENVNLDCTANIVSLCSNCHNMLHYGINNEEVLKKLYDKKNEQLKSRGIDISFEDLLQYYR